jgi:hypothetical protein
MSAATTECARSAAGIERERIAAMADAWSARFDALLEAGGNDVIDARAARQLRRYFAGFATEIRAEMHLPDPVSAGGGEQP